MNASRTVPPPHIALTFVALALATLGATLVWVLTTAVAPLALLHALVVGVFLMVAMGLLYQFIPVVAMAPLRYQRLPLVHAAMAVGGTICILIGFQGDRFGLVRTGGVLHIVGLGIEIFVLVMTAVRGKPPAPVRGAMMSLLWLFLAMVIGIWMAYLLSRGSAVGTLAQYHAIFGLVGFFGTIITALTFRLLRMFDRVDREPHTLAFTMGTTIATIALAFTGIFGAYAAAVVAMLFSLDLALIGRSRNPAYQPETFAYGTVSAVAGLLAALCYIRGLVIPATMIIVWFFIGTAVIGYLQRIVPFIWWIARSRREGARGLPTLSNMNHSGLGYFILSAWTLAGITWLYLPQPHIAAAIALIAWCALIVQLGRPFVLEKKVVLHER